LTGNPFVFFAIRLGTTIAREQSMNKETKRQLKRELKKTAKEFGFTVVNCSPIGFGENNAVVNQATKTIYLGKKTTIWHFAHEIGHILDWDGRYLEYNLEYFACKANRNVLEIRAWVFGWTAIKGIVDKSSTLEEYKEVAHDCFSTYSPLEEDHSLLDDMLDQVA
jgi:hypothetical protein